MHTKVVLTMSVALTVGGAVIFRITEDMPWIGALFNSVTARTAGFSTYSLGEFSNAGLLAMIFLMFVGRVARLHRRRNKDEHAVCADTGA